MHFILALLLVWCASGSVLHPQASLQADEGDSTLDFVPKARMPPPNVSAGRPERGRPLPSVRSGDPGLFVGRLPFKDLSFHGLHPGNFTLQLKDALFNATSGRPSPAPSTKATSISFLRPNSSRFARMLSRIPAPSTKAAMGIASGAFVTIFLIAMEACRRWNRRVVQVCSANEYGEHAGDTAQRLIATLRGPSHEQDSDSSLRPATHGLNGKHYSIASTPGTGALWFAILKALLFRRRLILVAFHPGDDYRSELVIPDGCGKLVLCRLLFVVPDRLLENINHASRDPHFHVIGDSDLRDLATVTEWLEKI